MPLPERILIDHSAFCAILSSDDVNHDLAVQVYERLIDREQEIWVASSTIIKVVNSLHREFGIQSLLDFKDSIDGVMNIIWLEGIIYRDALALAAKHAGNDVAIDDYITCIVAQRLQAYVFTFNSCLDKMGIPTLPR